MVSLIIAFLAGALTMFTGLFYGLKWNIQLKQEEKPTVPNPIKAVVEARKEAKTEKDAEDILAEWLYGKQEVE